VDKKLENLNANFVDTNMIRIFLLSKRAGVMKYLTVFLENELKLYMKYGSVFIILRY